MAVRPTRRRLTALAAAALAVACAPRGDPSAASVRGLARDANRRDAAAIVAVLAPDFRGPAGMRRDDLEGELRRLFAAYASVDVSVSDVSVDPLPDFDLVRFRAAFRGTARRIGGLAELLPSDARYRFELRLVRDGDRRTVTDAQWQEDER
ncbi:MAG TPA: hypothetical protein VFL12_11520 [Thermoanaerobaculia bacterium]|nr:hypothetical protein [Thermoanaerobaculia bacterium]